jgi:predicted DNA binding CopG/RHH family protein
MKKLGRPPRFKNELSNSSIVMRLTDREMKNLQNEATRQGLSKSELIRRVLFSPEVVARWDLKMKEANVR